MATETTNLKLNKPDKTDFYNVDLVNDNMDKIDKAIGGINNQIARGEGGNINLPSTFNGGLLLKELQGKSVQNGTPTPENKVNIVSVGDSGNVVVKVYGKNTLTSHEPYKEQVVTISLAQPLRSVGDAYDRIIKKDGVWGVERYVKSFKLPKLTSSQILEGASGKVWRYGRHLTDGMVSSSADAYKYVLCEQSVVIKQTLEETTGKAEVSAYGHKESFELRFNGLKSLYSTKEAYVNYLNSVDYNFIYRLNKPTWTPLSDAQQDQLNKLQTYQGVTNVFTTDKQQPNMIVEYGTTDTSALSIYANNIIDSKLERVNLPTKLPADGGNADTVGGKHVHELSQKEYLVANGVDLFKYIESLTDEQLPPCSTVTIRAFNCKNSPADGYPFTVEYSSYNGGDFIITVTRLEHKDWYILSAREVSTNRMYTCGKHANVWKSWSLIGDIVILPDGTDIEKQFLNNQASDYAWTIRTFRIANSESAPTSLGYDPNNNDFYYTVYKMGHDWMKLEARDVRSNRQFVNSKLGGAWTGWIENVQTNTLGHILARREQGGRQEYEGGQINIEKPVKTGLSGDIVMDIVGNYFRLFEEGGNNRGVQLDITTCSSRLRDKILTSKNVTVSIMPPELPNENDLWIW